VAQNETKIVVNMALLPPDLHVLCCMKYKYNNVSLTRGTNKISTAILRFHNGTSLPHYVLFTYYISMDEHEHTVSALEKSFFLTRPNFTTLYVYKMLERILAQFSSPMNIY